MKQHLEQAVAELTNLPQSAEHRMRAASFSRDSHAFVQDDLLDVERAVGMDPSDPANSPPLRSAEVRLCLTDA